jgi:hypothetical protein
LEGSPVQAKSACVLNSKGQREDGRWRSRPGLIYVKRPEMEHLANLDFQNYEGLEDSEYSSPALLHTSVHYPMEDMPELQSEIPTKEIGSPEDPEYSFRTAYIGEIVVPVKPMFENNTGKFCGGEREAWPLEWPEAFGKEGEEGFMRYWREL